VAGEARVDEARRRVRQQAEPAERGLSLHPGRDVVGQRHDLVGRPQDELPRVQDERLVALGLDLAGEVRLVGGRVDVRVAVVLEDPEEPVQPDVDGAGLQHRRVPGIHGHPPGVDLGEDVAVGQQHGDNLPGLPLGLLR
jgi:hypothetical protein